MKTNMKKLEDAIHKIVSLCDTPHKLGAVKLNKILWYSDVYNYRTTGSSITGSTSYIKRKRGPVHPKTLKGLSNLKSSGRISINENVAPYMCKEYRSLQMPLNKYISSEEAEVLTSVTNIIVENYSAEEISDVSHNESWEIAKEGEDIPMSTSLLSTFDELPTTIKNWEQQYIA